MIRLILASASPRRKELLAALVAGFEVVPAEVDEELLGDARSDAVRLARDKALAIAAAHPGAVVLGSDTIVTDGHRSYGKPADPGEAMEMLRSLRGRRHEVVTGVTVVAGGVAQTEVSATGVWLGALPDAAIEAYVASGRPLDKAGAYAIQDADVPTVDRLDGCYCCVVGLPLWTARRMLESSGVPCKSPGESFARCANCPDRPLLRTGCAFSR